MIKIVIPPIIKIGSHEYDIIFDEAQDDKSWRGTFSDRQHKIILNPKLHPQQLRITFLHEIIHLTCDLNSLEPPEQDVDRLAESLGDLLFRWLGVDLDLSEVPTLERKIKE